MPAAKDIACGLLMLPSLLQPKSEGFIELRSADPREHPVIEPNYLQHPDDLEVMVQTFELCRKVARSMQVTELVDETVPHPVESREYMAHKLARDAVTIYHPTSTCKMGPADRPMSVLDPATLRVWGVQGLRVVDCSSMPELPAASAFVRPAKANRRPIRAARCRHQRPGHHAGAQGGKDDCRRTYALIT